MIFLTRASLKNRLIVGLLTLSIALVGVFSMSSLKQEMMPSMQVPVAYVSLESPGLAPEEMVTTITEPIEKAMQAVPGVKSVVSSTSSGFALVNVEWPFNSDDGKTLSAIRAAASSLKATFPRDTEVEVFSGGSDDYPAMILSVGTNGDTAIFGDKIAQNVVPALKAVAGVRKIEFAGSEDERIVIELRTGDVERLKVDPNQIGSVLEAHGVSLPAGQADSATGSLSIIVGTTLTTVEEIAALPIVTENGVVRVSEFADVRTESVPGTALSRVNGKPALTLQVTPNLGANVVDISHAVTAELDSLAPGLDAEFVTIFDQAPYIEQSVHDLSVEGGLGLLFAVIVLLAFLGSWRSTVIAAVSIPLSLLVTLVGLWVSGNTLNILTLGALTIAIGRVIDDSIVVIENISRRSQSGQLTIEDVVASVRQVAGAITASTLTTVAVFLPIVFLAGTTGQLFRPFAITVTIALLASLVVALTIVPVLAFWLMRAKRARHTSGENTNTEAPETITPEAAVVAMTPVTGDDLSEMSSDPDRLQRAIMPALEATRRHPVITLVSSGVILALTLGLSVLIPTDFIGSSGNESVQLTQTPNTARTSEELIAAAEPIEQALAKVDGVRDVLTSIPLEKGDMPPVISYDVLLESHAKIEEVEPAVTSVLEQFDEADEIQAMTQDSFVDGAGGGGIALQIKGNDPVALRKGSDLLKEHLTQANGVQSVRSDLAGEQTVVRVKLDEVKAAQLGFDRALVARAIQEALEGKTIGQLMLNGKDRSILLRTPGTERTVEQLGEMLLPVTPQQTAAAQKIASDALENKANAEAEQARVKANTEFATQMREASSQRAELVRQIAELNAQLAVLNTEPVVPESPLSPEEESLRQAQMQRSDELAALESALAGALSGIDAVDEQVASLRQIQADSATQLAEQQRLEAEQKQATTVSGTAIPISAIATVEEELTAPMITRADGERQVVLTVTPNTGQLDAATRAVEQAIATVDLPPGVSFELGGLSAEQDEAFTELGIAMLAAILLVLLVMVATFRNFRGPFILLVSIPFAATGAILGLLITGTALGIPALIGLLMLIGIVVTNAIVLMDLINRLRLSGASITEAVEHGTRLRLRPILMTAAATVFALIPMSLGLTGGGVFISKPLAIVVIGGLISSTLLTLILVPILYTGIESRVEQRKMKRASRHDAPTQQHSSSVEQNSSKWQALKQRCKLPGLKTPEQ